MHVHEASKDAEVDIIFAGGGTAACVAAGRLASADPNLKILIVEGGRNNLNDPRVENTALAMTHLAPDSTTALFYKSEPSDAIGGRELVIPAGGMFGGGSSINLGMYTRAQGSDYDEWRTPGWEARDIIPLCNKTETYHSASGSLLNLKKHGTNGPIQISDGCFRSPSEHAIMQTITKLEMKEVTDVNDFETVNGFMKIPRYVSPNGKRQDAAHCFIHPLSQRSGVHQDVRVLFNSTITRVLFDQTATPPRAIGVEYREPSENSESGRSQSLQKAFARLLVVISSGALGSPQILERSGVGCSELLQKAGIPLVVDLPGVGENYQDHPRVTSSYKTSLLPNETLDEIAFGRMTLETAFTARDPRLGWNTIDVAGKIRPRDAEAAAIAQTFHHLWQRDWVPQPNKPLLMTAFVNVFDEPMVDVDPDGQYLTIGNILLYPYSRGSIHITNASDGYILRSGFLNEDFDVKALAWGYKQARNIARKLPFFRGEVAATHPQYQDSSATAVASAQHVCEEHHEHANETYSYSPEDEAAIETWVRSSVRTTWHSLGTCAMKPREAGGVVDPQLNVFGTKSLKVADLSIAPENIGANVGNTAFAVGEKAAAIIAGEFGINL